MRRPLLLAMILLASGSAARAEDPVDAYDARLEEIAREVEAIRKDLEAVAREVAWAGMAEAFVFVDKPDPSWRDRAVAVVVDGKPVASHRFLPEEWELLDRGVAVQVARVWVKAGEHRVWIGPADAGPGEPVVLEAGAAETVSWVATAGEEGVGWRAQ